MSANFPEFAILHKAIRIFQKEWEKNPDFYDNRKERKKWVMHPVADEFRSGIDELYGIDIEYDPLFPEGLIKLVDK